MSILVTGGAGYIGSHCVLALLGRGEKVVVIDDLCTGFQMAVPKSAAFVRGDVGDGELVSNVIRQESITSIIHFAASTVVPEFVAKPLSYYKNNTANSRNLIECAMRAQVKHFIFSSTAAVYGDGDGNPVSETAPICPMSPYGSSKAMTERILADTAPAGGPKYIILRYFNVAGADPSCRTGQSTARATHLIKVACQAVLSKDGLIEVFGRDYPTRDGTCIRDYIHVTDLADAHLSALDYLFNGGGSDVFNCGYGEGYSVLEVIQAVEDVSGRKLRVEFSGRRPGDPPVVVASNAKIQASLSWRPRLNNLKTIISDALRWEKHLATVGDSVSES